jgi:hypothetical protein
MADDYIQLAAPFAEAARRLVDKIIGIEEPGMAYAGGSSIKIMSML